MSEEKMIPDKLELMNWLLQDAWVLVHLDPRRDGVDLPDHLRQQKHLILQYGYNMPVPIADFSVDEQGIKACLSFQRVPHATVVPWSAVFGMTDGEKRGYVWEADVPPDLNQPDEVKEKPAPTKPGKKPRPSHLKLVD